MSEGLSLGHDGNGHVPGSVPRHDERTRQDCPSDLAERRHRRRESQAAGSVTTSRSPSSATSPPSARMTLTATEAPRSLGSSPSTIGAASGDDRLDRHLGARYDRRDLDAAMTRGRARQPCERALERSGVSLNARALTRGAGNGSLRELERVDRAQDRLVASTLDPGRDREEVEQLDELVTRRIDDPEIAGGRLADVLADQRLREPLDRRERRPQVVAREGDETGEVLGHRLLA